MGDANHSPQTADIGPVLRRHMAVLFATQALSTAVFMLMPALGGIMVLHLTDRVAATGLAVAVFQLGQTISAYPGGRLMDHYGRRTVLLCAAALSAAASAAIAAAFGTGQLALFLAAALAFGFASGPLRQIAMVAAEIQRPENRASAAGLALTGSVAGVLIMPALVAWLTRGGRAEADGIGATWISGALLLAVAAAVLALLRPDPLEIARRLGVGMVGRTSESRGGMLRHPNILTPMVVSAVLWGTMTLTMVVTPVALRQHGHDLSAVVSAVSIHAIGMFAFGLPLGRLADRIGRRTMMAAGLVACAAGAFGSMASTAYWAATACLFLVGVGWSAGLVAATALLTDATAPELRGRTFGVSEFASRLANLLFPLAGAAVVGAWGFAGSAGVVTAVTLLPIVLVWRMPSSTVASSPSASG